MRKRITLAAALVSGAALVVELFAVSPASAVSTKTFCAALSNDGGTAALVQPATSGAGAAASVTPLQKLAKASPSKNLKSTLSTLATLYGRLGHAKSLSDLSAKDTAALQSATTKLNALTSKLCGSTTPAVSASALSGTWSGQYSGASEGTFTLTWQQAGSALTGTIMISDLGDAPLPINGTVTGGAIKFGTVGTLAITYTGSVTGNTMSGTYQAPTGSGNWSATKST